MRYLIVIIILFITGSTFAQSTLLVTKRGKTMAQYSPGEDIRFKLKDEKYYHKAMITGFSQNAIHFHYFHIDLDEIDIIDLGDKKRSWLNVVSALTWIGGVGFIAIDLFNQGVVDGRGFEPAPQTLMISGALIGVSGLANLINRKRIPISRSKFDVKLY